MKRLFKLAKYIYYANKSHSIADKIKRLQNEKSNIDSALMLGYSSEEEFIQNIKNHNDKLKAKDNKVKMKSNNLPKLPNIEEKERLQKLAGITPILFDSEEQRKATIDRFTSHKTNEEN